MKLKSDELKRKFTKICSQFDVNLKENNFTEASDINRFNLGYLFLNDFSRNPIEGE